MQHKLNVAQPLGMKCNILNFMVSILDTIYRGKNQGKQTQLFSFFSVDKTMFFPDYSFNIFPA